MHTTFLAQVTRSVTECNVYFRPIGKSNELVGTRRPATLLRANDWVVVTATTDLRGGKITYSVVEAEEGIPVAIFVDEEGIFVKTVEGYKCPYDHASHSRWLQGVMFEPSGEVANFVDGQPILY